MTEQQLQIRSIKRIHGRAMLTLTDGETLSMPRAMLKERPYRSGMPFDRASFETFILERSYPFALEKAVSMLAMRSRSQKELKDALQRNAYPERTIRRVLERMREAGYIDDVDFAKTWASSRTTRGMGARKISMELRQKGVSSETIDETLSSLDEDAVFDGALKIARKAAHGKDITSPSDRQKISAALIRRGYDYSTARQAIVVLTDESKQA